MGYESSVVKWDECCLFLGVPSVRGGNSSEVFAGQGWHDVKDGKLDT